MGSQIFLGCEPELSLIKKLGRNLEEAVKQACSCSLEFPPLLIF